MPTLNGRRVLVTGASGALGGATMAALERRGSCVRGLDVAAGERVVACDLRDGGAVRRAVASATAELGGLDAVVHFAGVGIPTSAGAAPLDDVRRTLEVNLLGPWRVTAECVDALVAARGRLVFVASELALATLPFAAAYSVSKRGLCAYADSVRAEYGTHVGVTTIYPGYVRTPIHDLSVAAGLPLEAAARAQSVDAVVRTVLRALEARRSPRDLACSPLGRFDMAFARHTPRLVDAVVRRRLRHHVARGRYGDAPLAAALRARIGFPDPVRPPSALEEVRQ